jgi:dihydroorotase
MSLRIRHIRAVDPKNGLDATVDILIDRGRIAKIAGTVEEKANVEIDAAGLVAIPGLLDLHVHFREPGYEYKETIETGCGAALRGGYVGCVTMPNTNPPCDNQSVVAAILRRARDAHFNVFPCGTISKGRQGKEISEMAELREAGCVAVSDDGSFVANSLLMRHAMEYATMFDFLVISHAIDNELSRTGVMNEGKMSTVLGLKGSPNAAEDIAVMRDIALAKMTGCRLHIAHVSTEGAVKLIREAKREGVRVTCEVAPHHFALTDEALIDYDTRFKMNPPLRTRRDVEEIKKGLSDGTIDVIATDHAPHSEEEKEQEFVDAPFGVIGLETALGVALTELYHTGLLSLEEIVWKMALRPAEVIGLSDFNEIREGCPANLALINLSEEWTVLKEDFLSKSKNSCFIGKRLKGRVHHTLCNGELYSFEIKKART